MFDELELLLLELPELLEPFNSTEIELPVSSPLCCSNVFETITVLSVFTVKSTVFDEDDFIVSVPKSKSSLSDNELFETTYIEIVHFSLLNIHFLIVAFDAFSLQFIETLVIFEASEILICVCTPKKE